MNRYVPKYNVYVTPNGTSTLDSNGGQNKLVVAKGAPVSPESATRLNLPELEAERIAKGKPAPVEGDSQPDNTPVREPRTRARIFTKEQWKDYEKEQKVEEEAAKKAAKETEKPAEPVVEVAAEPALAEVTA